MGRRYAVQYEDDDKEEFVKSELTKKGKKNMLQPAGVEERTDYEELDRLYAQAQAEWAAGADILCPYIRTNSCLSMYWILTLPQVTPLCCLRWRAD